MHAEDRPSWLNPPKERSAWGIALGVAAGIIIGGGILFGAARWYEHYQLRKTLEAIQAQTKAAAEATQRRLAAERARREAVEEKKRQDEAEQQRAAAEAAFAQQREQQRREDAWARFYKRPESCVQPVNSAVFTECANEHIRAKRRFEELWAAGKL